MNRYLSIDVLRGVIMIIMALDHVIGAISRHPDLELSFINQMFAGYESGVQKWSRMMTHLCAPGFQLLAGMGLAISVARSQKNGVSEEKITSDMLMRGIVLIFADFVLMLPVFRQPLFFMVLACIGSCTLCFALCRWLPRHLILVFGLAVILLSPWYKGLYFLTGSPQVPSPLTSGTYLIDIWTQVGFGGAALGILYPIIPWLGVFAIGWWIGLQLADEAETSQINRSARTLMLAGAVLVAVGIMLRLMDWRTAEGIQLSGASILDPAFWQFTKYPPSWVFLSLTLGVLLWLLGVFRIMLDRSSAVPAWTKPVTVYGRTALFYFIVHFYLIGLIAMWLGVMEERDPEKKFGFGMAYLVWFGVLLLMWPLCFGYDKLRQRYRMVLRYF
jgi:uncharacterized membrane protein